ncbi:MAG: cupin domain-containing protein [Parafilimonas terrae]|nr:cupin domain-containing protein [Parafilimonas terrae]
MRLPGSGSRGAAAVGALAVACLAAGLATSLADEPAPATKMKGASFEVTGRLDRTIAGEPLSYPSSGNPVITSEILTIQPGGWTDWMTHPVPAYVFVLDGTLTVEFVDGSKKSFGKGESFLQAHATWHRGLNEQGAAMRFLAVFIGEKDVPTILNPPSGGVTGR